MIATLRIDSPPNSNRSHADAANLFINLFDGTGRDYDVSLNMYRQIEPAVQLSDFVGRYVRQDAFIDMTLNANGELEGTYQACTLTGTITERMDTPTQEFSATIQFTGCPASNNFAVDANYTGFGFAGSSQGRDSAVMSIYIKGSNALRGPSTYVFNLDPALKE